MEGPEAGDSVGCRIANPPPAAVSSEASTSSFSRQPRHKQLIFDRRYGWVYEEWVEPSEHANIGGRGMFSIVPLTLASFRMACRGVDVAADFAALSIENRDHMVSEARERWRSAGLQASRQFVRCVDTVPFLSKGRIALSASLEASLGQQRWEPVLQSASRISTDLTSAGRAAGSELGRHFRDGVHLLRQGMEVGHRRAQELLAEALGQEGAFPPPVFHRLTGHWLQLSGQLNDTAALQLLADLKIAGMAVGSESSHRFLDGVHFWRQALEEGHRRAQDRLTEVLGQDGTFPPPVFHIHRVPGHCLQLSRQFNDKVQSHQISTDLTSAGRVAVNELSHHVRDGVQLLRQGLDYGHRRAQEQLVEVLEQEGAFPEPVFSRLTGHWSQLSRQFNDTASHQLRQATAFLVHVATYVATYALALRNNASEGNTALSGTIPSHVSGKEEVRALDFNDYLLSNSRLLTMVAAPSDDEQGDERAQPSSPPSLADANASFKAYSRTGGKGRKKRFRQAQG